MSRGSLAYFKRHVELHFAHCFYLYEVTVACTIFVLVYKRDSCHMTQFHQSDGARPSHDRKPKSLGPHKFKVETENTGGSLFIFFGHLNSQFVQFKVEQYLNLVFCLYDGHTTM